VPRATTPGAPSATQGIIVVPTPPRSTAKSGAGEERHAAGAPKPSPASAHHETPARNQKPVARGKQAHHEADHAIAAANGGASRAAGTPEAAGPDTQPAAVVAPPAPEPASTVTASTARSGPALAHKLRATSIPSEAEVLLDGKLIGRTPLFGAEVDVSQTHTLTIRKDGYAPYEQPVSSSSAWVTRASDNAAALRIQTVLQKLDHNAVAAAPAISAPTPSFVATSSAALSASSHKLRITSIPTDAEVLLDGKSVGRTPLFGADIDMSRPHRLVLRKEGYALFEQTITTSSDWVIKPSDRTSALLRISALLRRSDAALAQNPAAAP
jgi:CRISPR/Cas system-associated exonuclease Cas4 (RecB family)